MADTVPVDGVPDMTALEHLGEESMLRNLEIRLLNSPCEPYTLVSTVLVAARPRCLSIFCLRVRRRAERARR